MINEIQARSGAKVAIPRSDETQDEVTCSITGTRYCIDIARVMIEEILARSKEGGEHKSMRLMPSASPAAPRHAMHGMHGMPPTDYSQQAFASEKQTATSFSPMQQAAPAYTFLQDLQGLHRQMAMMLSTNPSIGLSDPTLQQNLLTQHASLSVLLHGGFTEPAPRFSSPSE